ncbi:efflux RND transporter periplasmic adaptor subunit [Vibrio sp. CK2-1]|uniref:efflux RND transporter periplasmic adaptor subunit n=1 Tax=Vibrio sp. CK2-1 TaxID=2912249 RepID=UPI001F01828C|nr:efflux RND transporter periplasmic adaptor subunit [Vibrio sp. CK2-1]MCF7353152.1 efflux RND transporter periplasmic adaptor subunit [Vibrio sp. CK2-1]
MKFCTAILMMIVSVTMLSACTESDPEPPATSKATPDTINNNPPMTVSVSILHQENSYPITHRFLGLVSANQQANLGFERSGKVSSIHVQIGEKVSKGQVLIKLDTDMLESQQKQIQAQQSRIRAELDLANKKLQRQSHLKSKGFSADANIDDLTSQIDVLKANALELNERLKANLLEQQKSILTAPYSGVISSRFISLGDIVTLSSPTVTLLSDEKPELHVGIPTKYRTALAKQTQFEVDINDQRYSIERINSGAEVDKQSRTVNLHFELPETQNWVNGQIGYLVFQESQPISGFWVPLSALTNGIRGTWNVYVVVPNEEHLTTERRSIEVIYANSHHAYIRGAISNDEKFVTEGLHRIVPGQDISIATKDPVLSSASPSQGALEAQQ